MTNLPPGQSDFAVGFEVDSLRGWSAGGNLSGQLWIELAGESFPEHRWSDLALPVIGMWLGELVTMADDPRHVASCPFMDGPYSFTIADAGTDGWTLTCLEDEEPAALPALVLPASAVRAPIVRAGRELLAHCERVGWHNRDTERLAARLVRLGA